MSDSPFFDVAPTDWLASNGSAFAIADRFPVSPGHALVISRRLIPTWFDATQQEQHDLLDLVGVVKNLLDEQHGPTGYNVGFNAGAAAGQTVDHLHVHVIPRYDGDVPDPRGGVRHVIPALGNYLTEPAKNQPAATPSFELLDGQDRLLKLDIKRCLINPDLDHVDLLVSFIMKSGVGLIDADLSQALERGAKVRVLTTDYMAITDPDALARLLDLAEDAESQTGQLELRVFSDASTSFHPKAYLFSSSTLTYPRAFVGSSNLSASGLGGGIEWNLGTWETDALLAGFDQLWTDQRTQVVDQAWVRDYRTRFTKRRPAMSNAPTSTPQDGQDDLAAVIDLVGDSEGVEPLVEPVAPTPIQVEALSALETSRRTVIGPAWS